MNNEILICPNCTKEAIHTDKLIQREQCINCGYLLIDYFNSGSASFSLAAIASISFGYSYDLIGSIATVLLVILVFMKK